MRTRTKEAYDCAKLFLFHPAYTITRAFDRLWRDLQPHLETLTGTRRKNWQRVWERALRAFFRYAFSSLWLFDRSAAKTKTLTLEIKLAELQAQGIQIEIKKSWRQRNVALDY